MAWSIVQNPWAKKVVSCGFTTNTAGNVLVAAFAYLDASNVQASISDTNGNTWQGPYYWYNTGSGSGLGLVVYICLNAKAYAGTNTVTFSGTGIATYAAYDLVFLMELTYGAGYTYTVGQTNNAGAYSASIAGGVTELTTVTTPSTSEFVVAVSACWQGSQNGSSTYSGNVSQSYVGDSATLTGGLQYVVSVAGSTTISAYWQSPGGTSYTYAIETVCIIPQVTSTIIAQKVGGLRQAISATVGTLYPGERFVPTLREAATIGATPGELGNAVGLTYYYVMRRTDTGVAGGYVFWINTDGSASGSPTAVGVQGAPMILARHS